MQTKAAPCQSYVLLTAAYNEESFIAGTIESVIRQTVLPALWIIVSDGSTDGTDQVVLSYASRYPFVRFLRVERTQSRGVISKVHALNVGYRQLEGIEYEFIGNLDGDVSLAPSYYEMLLTRFQRDSMLGIGGGFIHEKQGKAFHVRRSNSRRSVAHAGQLLRRECYEAIGGYVPLKYGGEDWCAEVNARMRGWRVEAFPDLKIMHHRSTGAADRLLRHCFRQGKMDFSVGSHVAFELLKCVRRIPEHPVMLGAIARFCGFCWCHVRREEKLVSPEMASFLREEQSHRLKLLLSRDLQ